MGWLVYHEKVKTSAIFLRDSSMVSPYSLILFGGRIFLEEKKNLLKVDNWIKFKMDAEESHVIKAFRMALDRLLLHRIENPGEHSSVEMTSTIDGIIRLIDSEEHGDLTNVPWQCVEPTPSRAVDGGSGGNGAARVCFDFQAGKCRRGAGCNFAHTTPQGAAAEAQPAQPKPKAGKPAKQQTRAGAEASREPASEPAMPRLK